MRLFPKATNWLMATQCTSTEEFWRCVRETGHRGPHMTWRPNGLPMRIMASPAKTAGIAVMMALGSNPVSVRGGVYSKATVGDGKQTGETDGKGMD